MILRFLILLLSSSYLQSVGLVVISALLTWSCVDLRVPNPNARFIAFGDSTTAGLARTQYHQHLSVLMNLPSDAIANEGKSGETASEGLERLTTILESGRYPSAKVLLYWQGGNDITDFVRSKDPFLLFAPDDSDYPFKASLAKELDRIQADVEAAIRKAKQHGLFVYASTYYPLLWEAFDCPAFPLDIVLPYQAHRANVYQDMLNERIRIAIFTEGATLVDLDSIRGVLLEDHDNYENCNHLSDTGNEIVAGVFYDAMHNE